MFDWVHYYFDANGKEITGRRSGDKLYLIKIRDYTLPIAAYFAKQSNGRFGPYSFYYVARGDGTIMATYAPEQVVEATELVVKEKEEEDA